MRAALLNTTVIVINVVLLLFSSAIVQADNYYVADPRGADGIAGNSDDVNSSDTYDGTLNRPFATLTKVCSVAVAGDTVLIMGGVYNQTLRPENPGTSDSVITFKNYDNTEVVIKDTPGLSNLTQDEIDLDQEGRQYGIYLYGLSYVTIQGLTVTHVSGWSRVVKCRHITIQNNNFTNALSSGTTGSVKYMFSDRNKVLNNILHDGNDNLLLIHSDSNLVAGNHMMKGRHSIWCIRAGFFNIIRNNYCHNEIQKIGEIYDAENDPPLIFDTTKYNLVEANQFAKTASSGNASPYAGIQFAGQRCIIRKNLFYETIGPGLDLTLYSDEARYNYENRIYNNVFYKTDFAGVSISGSTSYTFYDNIFKNNIFFKSIFVANDERWPWYTDELEGKPVQVLTGRQEDFVFENNNFFNQTAGESYLITYGNRTSSSNPPQHEVAWWENNHPTLFKGSLEKDPLFVNEVNHDFHLQDSSQMIDAGTFLTYTSGPGNGTVMPVKDAKYFYSGFGITGETGDLIQLSGQNLTAEIIDINYTDNSLVLDRALTWSDSQGVALSYAGNGPDLGAYEHGSTAIHDVYHGNSHSDKNRFITAYYNPFKNQVHISFGLSEAEDVQLSLFTLNGKRVKKFYLGKKEAGIHSVHWDVNSFGLFQVSSGIYIVLLHSKVSNVQTKLFYMR
jgi:hypothetical protein